MISGMHCAFYRHRLIPLPQPQVYIPPWIGEVESEGHR